MFIEYLPSKSGEGKLVLKVFRSMFKDLNIFQIAVFRVQCKATKCRLKGVSIGSGYLMFDNGSFVAVKPV